MEALCHWVELKAHIIGNESALSARRWLRIFPDSSAIINYTPINEFFANMVQQILQMDANGSNHKRPVVSIAARQGSASQLRLLAQEGGDLWSDLASMPLPSFMQLDALQFLVDVQGLDLTSLFTAMREPPAVLHPRQPGIRLPQLTLLCNPGIRINAQDELGNTALMRYCSGPTAHFFEHTVEDLLQHPGINTTIANQKGQDALQLAQHQGNRELVSMLISHQAKHCEDEGVLT